MTSLSNDAPAVLETRLMHNTHRRATSLLADAVTSGDVTSAEVVELRDLVVAMLRHHHDGEDQDLWPLLIAADPSLRDPLGRLTDEHHHLDSGLDALHRTLSSEHALAVRDQIHAHLDHEEPVLFPALRTAIDDATWTNFSQHMIATAPQVGVHLLVGLMHEVGSPAELDVVLRNLPPEVAAAVPGLIEQAQPAFAVLRGARR